MITHCDLFAGIGGFAVAFERAGAKTVAAVENDKYCQQVLVRHFPDATLFGDIREVSADDLRATGFVPERGVITGGVPCQDWSIAGRRAGIDGERSGLFWHFVRLLGALRPTWFIFENVSGLLSSNNGRDFGAVLGSLAKCGYGFAYRIFDAQHFGVPQRRRRVFIVGHLGASGRAPAEVLFESESLSGDSSPGQETKTKTAYSTGGGTTDGGRPIAHMSDDAYVADKVSTLQGGGHRGYRIDAEGAAGGHLVSAMEKVGRPIAREGQSILSLEENRDLGGVGVKCGVRRLTPL